MSVIFRFFGQCFRGSAGGENTALLQADEEDAEMVDLFAKWQTALWALAITLAYIIAGVTIYCLAESQWNFLDSFYFVAVTITTVGYGDVYPTSIAMKLFTILFILGAIAILGFALSIVGEFLLKRQEKLLQQLSEGETQTSFWKEYRSLIRSTVILGLFFAFGTVFFALAESWNVIDALYYTVVTCTTVGYGDYTPKTTLGKIVAIPFIIIGTFVIASALGNFADFFIQKKQKEIAERILSRKLTVTSIATMDADGDGRVSLQEFVEHMLVKLGKCDEKDLKDIKAQFRKLDVDNSGSLDEKDLEQL